MWITYRSGPGSVNPNGPPNTILFLLDEPVAISCIKIWNYSKTPTRGVREFEVIIPYIYIYYYYAEIYCTWIISNS